MYHVFLVLIYAGRDYSNSHELHAYTLFGDSVYLPTFVSQLMPAHFLPQAQT